MYDYVRSKIVSTKSDGQIITLDDGSTWLSVEDCLPEDCTPVVVADGDYHVTIGDRCDGEWRVHPQMLWSAGAEAEVKEEVKVTHWMRLPSPPDVTGNSDSLYERGARTQGTRQLRLF